MPPLALSADAVAGAIARGAAEVPSEKPVASVFLSSKGAPPNLASGRRGPLPSYSFPENAARALAAAVKYARWRDRPRGTPAVLELGAARTARDVARRSLESRDEPHWLAPEDVEAVLKAAGIPLVAAVVGAPREARAAAEALGYPLVAKAVATGLVHKSDVGGVVLGLESDDAVEAAVRDLRERLRAAGLELEAV